jgi:ABC-2 type transport system permease protein
MTPAASSRPVPGGIGDASRTVPRPLADNVRALAAGARLGWAIESNWSDPFLFAIYSIIKPLGAALILVAIVWAISGGSQPGAIAFLIVGSASWAYVGGGILGLVGAILDDRERYRMLKYVAVSQAPFLAFLIGRSAAQLVIATAGFLVTIGVGVLFLGVRIDPSVVNWAVLAASMAGGLVGVMAIGIAMAGYCLQLRQEAWSYPEALAGALYLVSGTIYPIDVLPGPLQAIALALPTTWWLEGTRRALLGAPTAGRLASFDDASVLLALLATTCVLTLAGWAVFRFFERRARERGLLDQTTGS